MTIKYGAINFNDLFHEDSIDTFTYDEECLCFIGRNDTPDVSEVLFSKQWILVKKDGSEISQITKCDFVNELELPYTEIDVD